MLEAYASLTQSHRIDDPTIARIAAVRERYYAISAERRLKHPAVVAISEAANEMLMAKRPR